MKPLASEPNKREPSTRHHADELKRVRQQAIAEERRRIAQALHDQLCQHLLGAAFAAKGIATAIDPASPLADEAEHLVRLISSAVQQTRDIVRGLNIADGGGTQIALTRKHS